MVDLPTIDIDECGKKYEFTIEDHAFTIEIISSTEDYIRVLKSVFDFEKISSLFKRSDFHFYFDAINGGTSSLLLTSSLVSGAYAKPIFHDLLGAPLESLHNCTPKPVLLPFSLSFHRISEAAILTPISRMPRSLFMLWVWIVLVSLLRLTHLYQTLVVLRVFMLSGGIINRW